MEKIFIVTGASGSGKSTVIEYLLKLGLNKEVVFDIDSIINEASELAGKDVHFVEETWIPFRKIWINILKSTAESGVTPIFFAVADKEDFESIAKGLSLSWIALDCNDDIRLKRLEYRNCTKEQLEDILEDARKIREDFNMLIDTSDLSPEEVAKKLLSLINEEEE